VTEWITNARMYAVTPAVRPVGVRCSGTSPGSDAPHHLCAYPAPQPLEELWSRGDLGSVFMCGYPIALKLAAVTADRSSHPPAEWAAHRAVYRSRPDRADRMPLT